MSQRFQISNNAMSAGATGLLMIPPTVFIASLFMGERAFVVGTANLICSAICFTAVFLTPLPDEPPERSFNRAVRGWACGCLCILYLLHHLRNHRRQWAAPNF